MKFPFKITELSEEKAELFNKYFLENDGYFSFEGCWLRNQRPENKKQSGYLDETTVRRRYIHFYDKYSVIEENGINYLCLALPYLHISNTLPENEIDDMQQRVKNALSIAGFVQNDDSYVKDNMEVRINEYDIHPKNREPYPANYKSFDITIRLFGYQTNHITDRMWRLSTKMFRIPDVREQPEYIDNLEKIKPYLPAQIEMGCGPSIDANIPPLYEMHELYRVQHHITKKFYFADEDNLAEKIILSPELSYKTFAEVPLNCLNAELTKSYKIFGKLYDKGLFKGVVYNNNFDRLVRRMDIPETILRIYDLDTYLPKPSFEKDVKSLICIGCHADRRQIQKCARAKGLKVIYIDPEGFHTSNGFEPYLIEAPKNNDFILKMTFEEAMNLFNKEYK